MVVTDIFHRLVKERQKTYYFLVFILLIQKINPVLLGLTRNMVALIIITRRNKIFYRNDPEIYCTNRVGVTRELFLSSKIHSMIRHHYSHLCFGLCRPPPLFSMVYLRR